MQTDLGQKQLSWMLCDTFWKLQTKAQAATLSTAVLELRSPDELDEFEAFTSSQVGTYVEKWGGYGFVHAHQPFFYLSI